MPPKSHCGNPLWRDWLEEEKLKCQERGLKSADSYGKAARSVAQCPVTYTNPKELRDLNGVGAKMIELLTKKWRIHCEEQGIEVPATPRKKRKHTGRTPSPGLEAEEDSPPAAAPKRKAPAKAAKTYIPNPRSGAYGLLIGLVLAIDDPLHNTSVFLTKAELVKAAGPYCDVSYTHPEKGLLWTGWSSMKQLVGKGYVYSTGNPLRYCLTEEGYDVACSIRAQIPEFAHIEHTPFVHETFTSRAMSHTLGAPARPRAAPPTIPLGGRPSIGTSSQRPSQDAARRTSGAGGAGRFQFWYIDNIGERVHSMSQALLRLEPNDFVNMRKLEFRHAQRKHPFVQQLKLVDTEAEVRDDSGLATLFGYMLEEVAPPTCSKFDDPPKETPRREEGASQKRRRSNSGSSQPDIDLDEDTPRAAPARDVVRPPPKKAPHELFAEIAGSSFARTHSTPVNIGANAPSPRLASQLAADAAARRLGPTLGATSSLSSIPIVRPNRPAPRLSSHIPIHNPLAPMEEHEIPANLPTFDPSSSIIFPAGSYEIVLIVDNREVESSKSGRDKFESDLKAKGVKVETRALRLGDMLWIARKLDGHGGPEDECVLDYVVERKRLDDLCTSIKDGRYTEQCFRLTSSAMRHVYYIIEDFQVTDRMEINGLQINTAKSQIQIHNRFFLKETRKLNETIDFLKTMTDVIIASHARTDLHVIPTRYLSRSTYSDLQKHLRSTHDNAENPAARKSYLISFEAYQNLNEKGGGQTLREKFARMMLCMKGMSAERVSALLEVWETPRGLWEDLKAHHYAPRVEEEEESQSGKKKKSKVREKEMFFADRVQGEGRRKIGDALSKEIYRNLMSSEDG